MKTTQLSLSPLGLIPLDYPRTFYRVEDWINGKRIADFTSLSEATAFAINDARKTGCRHDHKVCTVRLTR